MFPAGPLRAPLPPQIERTDALIVVGEGGAAEAVAVAVAARGKPVLTAHLRADDTRVASLRGKRVLAFAGIGDPARFFQDAAQQAGSRSSPSGPSPTIIRFRKARSKRWSRKPGAMH